MPRARLGQCERAHAASAVEDGPAVRCTSAVRPSTGLKIEPGADSVAPDLPGRADAAADRWPHPHRSVRPAEQRTARRRHARRVCCPEFREERASTVRWMLTVRLLGPRLEVILRRRLLEAILDRRLLEALAIVVAVHHAFSSDTDDSAAHGADGRANWPTG